MTPEQILKINQQFEAQAKKLDLTAGVNRYIKLKTARAWTAYLAKAKA